MLKLRGGILSNNSFMYINYWAGITFQCVGCRKVDRLTSQIAKLSDVVMGMGLIMAMETGGIESDDRERG